MFGWRTRYWNFMLKLAKSQPSWTIQASPGPSTGPFHWRNRKLSVKELSRLQTFPDDLTFDATRTATWRSAGVLSSQFPPLERYPLACLSSPLRMSVVGT